MAWYWAAAICTLGMASLSLSVSVDQSVYGLLGNLFMVIPPFVVFYGVKNIYLSVLLLKLQNVCGYVLVSIVIIIDAVLLSRRVTEYRYCYSDLNSLCYDDAEDSDTVHCRDEYDNAIKKSDDLNKVECEVKSVAAIFIAALLCNLIACLLTGPYMVVCSSIRAYVIRTTIDENLVSHIDKGLATPIVILKEGRRSFIEYEEEVVLATPYSTDYLEKESFEEAHPLVI